MAAVKLGDWLEGANIGAVWLLIGFVLVTMLVDFIMPAAIAKWAILAPIFIPLFLRLDVAPQTVLAAYRVGDSPSNVITPLMAYFPLIVIFAQRYRKDAGIGTVVSMMLPYVLVLSVVWTLFFVVWYLIGIPLGPVRRCTARALVRRCARDAAALETTRTSQPRPLAAVDERHRRSPSSSSPASSVVFVWDRLPVAIVAIGVALSLWATGVLDLDQALAGLRRPDRDLHRVALRRQRGARRDRRDGLGRAAADRARRARAARG